MDFCLRRWVILPFYLLKKGIADSSCYHYSVKTMEFYYTDSDSTVNLFLLASLMTSSTWSGLTVFHTLNM